MFLKKPNGKQVYTQDARWGRANDGRKLRERDNDGRKLKVPRFFSEVFLEVNGFLFRLTKSVSLEVEVKGSPLFSLVLLINEGSSEVDLINEVSSSNGMSVGSPLCSLVSTQNEVSSKGL